MSQKKVEKPFVIRHRFGLSVLFGVPLFVGAGMVIIGVVLAFFQKEFVQVLFPGVGLALTGGIGIIFLIVYSIINWLRQKKVGENAKPIAAQAVPEPKKKATNKVTLAFWGPMKESFVLWYERTPAWEIPLSFAFIFAASLGFGRWPFLTVALVVLMSIDMSRMSLHLATQSIILKAIHLVGLMARLVVLWWLLSDILGGSLSIIVIVLVVVSYLLHRKDMEEAAARMRYMVLKSLSTQPVTDTPEESPSDVDPLAATRELKPVVADEGPVITGHRRIHGKSPSSDQMSSDSTSVPSTPAPLKNTSWQDSIYAQIEIPPSGNSLPAIGVLSLMQSGIKMERLADPTDTVAVAAIAKAIRSASMYVDKDLIRTIQVSARKIAGMDDFVGMIIGMTPGTQSRLWKLEICTFGDLWNAKIDTLMGCIEDDDLYVVSWNHMAQLLLQGETEKYQQFVKVLKSIPEKVSVPTSELSQLRGMTDEALRVLEGMRITTLKALADARWSPIVSALNAASLPEGNLDVVRGWQDQARLLLSNPVDNS